MIQNPILTGFNPDPSICRVGDDYYIATSTFEWFPGVQIHHSRDLVNWHLVGRALDRVSQLDLRGCQNSAGVWAPCLTHADGKFWLLYTNVHHHGPTVVMDTPNYLVTADQIEGPWSEPIFLNASGFDPSLFHDDDDRKYIVQMQMGEALSGVRFDGIWLREFDGFKSEWIGRPQKIWDGSLIGITEGPHLLEKDGWYYLITAEGGTSLRHAISVCRSKNLWGPYETHPDNPILTAFLKDDMPFHSTGHGCFVETQHGEWFTVHLCQRPLQRFGRIVLFREENKSVPLGRETGLQKIHWHADGWPRLAHGDNSPRAMVEVKLPPHPWPADVLRDDFDGPSLNLHFQTLREPVDESWCSLTRREGWLSLRGRDSLASTFEQSLVARPLQHFQARAETCISFQPWNFKQTAGLIAYYDHYHYHYFRVTAAGEGHVKLGVISSENTKAGQVHVVELPFAATEKLFLRMENNFAELRFAWSTDGVTWNDVDHVFEATMLGDWVSPHSNFTGTFWGVCCQDLSDRSVWAGFDYFDYQPLPSLHRFDRGIETRAHL
jgi:xylan 1,4-beta-xylosidase